MAWISFGALPCRKRNLMTGRVSILLKSRASLTCFRVVSFLVGLRTYQHPCISIQLPSARPTVNVLKENFSCSKVLLNAKPRGVKENRWHGVTASRMLVFVLATTPRILRSGRDVNRPPYLATTLQKEWSYTCAPPSPGLHGWTSSYTFSDFRVKI